ncbi:MAG: hypothetical protein MN733_28005 [Nitrososphaera sp.]|nr:hypothetical protein [Nitrososphaera sp.]
MSPKICKWFACSLVSLSVVLSAPLSAEELAGLATAASQDQSIADRIFTPIYENLGHLILTAVAIWLAYLALRGDRKLRGEQLASDSDLKRAQLEFEKKKFDAEEDERKKLSKFREQEYKRFSEPAADIAEHLADFLIKDPHWAYRALEAAKLLPYTDTLFGERSKHFREEKQELADRFTPYLLKRCETIIKNQDRDVWLLVDAGTTLYPFFDIIGRETAKRWQQRESWLDRFHLATNNLPGIEQLIQNGRKIPDDRYSNLAIEDCRLLPGIPVPIFAAVAGDLTNEAIRNIRAQHGGNTRKATFIALVVGNWIRIRRSQPRCPVPMARGIEHRDVKQTFVDNADEVYVISPLGKIFVDYSNQEVNDALGFRVGATDQEDAPYGEIKIDGARAKTVKLVTTTRPEHAILHRHSNRVEDALVPTMRHPQISEENYAICEIGELPHLLFPFHKLPTLRIEEFGFEFPHYHTRGNLRLLEMFNVEEP